MSAGDVRYYGAGADGLRAARVEWPNGCEVQVRAITSQADIDAAADEIAAAAKQRMPWIAEAIRLRDEIARLRGELAAARAEIPPATPVRVGRGGCVRFAADGRLWLLACPEKGWSAWGVPCAGWDDLFRRYNVRVTEHGTDSHGAFWRIEPRAEPV